MLRVALVVTIIDGDSGSLDDCRKQIDGIEAEEKYSFSFFVNSEEKAKLQTFFTNAITEKFDFYLFVDGNMSLSENALAVMLENSEFLRHKAILTGSVKGADGRLFYGGRTKHGRLLEPDVTIPIPCRIYDTDLLLVPSAALEKLSTPGDIFRQHLFEYGPGERAAAAGVPRVIAPGILAKTRRVVEIPVWNNPEFSLKVRIKAFFNALNTAFIRAIHSMI